MSGKAARAARGNKHGWVWRTRMRKRSERFIRSAGKAMGSWLAARYAPKAFRRAVHRAYAKGRRG